MKQLLIQVDDETARRLERFAPARSRRRSAFVRGAIRKALWDAEERATAEAYGRLPDTSEEPFDPATWEPAPKQRRRRRG